MRDVCTAGTGNPSATTGECHGSMSSQVHNNIAVIEFVVALSLTNYLAGDWGDCAPRKKDCAGENGQDRSYIRKIPISRHPNRRSSNLRSNRKLSNHGNASKWQRQHSGTASEGVPPYLHSRNAY
jgi:hypothetical protein